MATNILYDRIIFALRKILEAGLPYTAYDLKPMAARCLVLIPIAEDQSGSHSDGTAYRYTVAVEYYTPSIKEVKRLSQEVADIKRLLNDNDHYKPASETYYCGGFVESIEYDWLATEEGDWKARLIWSCLNVEVS